MPIAFRSLTIPAFLVLSLVPAQAASHRSDKALDRLEPMTRMMEVCGIKAGEALRREPAYKTVNRVVVDAMDMPEIENHVVTGSGGAVRDKGRWYQLQFACTLTEDDRSAVSVTYTVGNEIPEEQWEEFGLWK